MDISFTINLELYKINPQAVDIGTSLNTFIRSHARLIGTKFMCLEGGCGACIVNIAGVKSANGPPRSMAVNSCLWPVYSCDGLAITTIEGIGGLKAGYHPIQKALWRFNGSQCGYCTPGMLMNMYSLLDANGGKVSMHQVENSFGGNICRCTGYRPILDAFKSLSHDYVSDDIEDLTLDGCSFNGNRDTCTAANRCTRKCSSRSLDAVREITDGDDRRWFKPAKLSALLKLLTTETMHTEYMLVAGNTAHGVYRRPETLRIFIDIKDIPELRAIVADEKALTFGGNVSLTDFMETLNRISSQFEYYSYCKQMADHIDLVAHVPVRNAGTIAGNLSIKHAHNEFPSDIFLLLEAVDAKLTILSTDGMTLKCSPCEYLATNMNQHVILNVVLPKLPSAQFTFRSYKIMPRAQNAHAMVNAAFRFEFDAAKAGALKSCRICFGGIHPQFVHATQTEAALTGADDFYSNACLQNAIKSLKMELQPNAVLPDSSPEYRANLAIGLLYRFYLRTAPADKVKAEYRSGNVGLERPISSGMQTYATDEKTYPITKALPKYDGLIQCAGEAQYSNDGFSHHSVDRELWAAFVIATEVHAKVVGISAAKALKMPGVRAFFSAKDIPGKNNFVPIGYNLLLFGEEEPIFLRLESEVQYFGQPVGVIVARTMDIANAATKLVDVQYERMGIQRQVIPSLSHWLRQGRPSGAFTSEVVVLQANAATKFAAVGQTHKLTGDFEMGSQFAYSMEPQTTFCVPRDDGGLDIYSSIQWMHCGHIAVADCLKVPQNKIQFHLKRMGGSYGYKISRASLIACACALASHLLRLPVRFVMTIESGMTVIGKRFGNAVEYTATVDMANGRIADLSLDLTVDFGCSLNEDVTMLTVPTIKLGHYARQNDWKLVVNRLKTDAPSATFVRAPGTLEGTAIQENIMEHIAREVKLDPAKVRLNNLVDEGLKKQFGDFLKETEYYERKADIEKFNEQNRWRKKGIAVSIMNFPVAYFFSTSVYVAIHHGDGTVSVSHGGSEVGQGIHTKVAQVCAHTLGIPYEMVSVHATNSFIAANTTFCGGSITSESVCMATKQACEALLERLKPVRSTVPNAPWPDLIQAAFAQFIPLTEKHEFDQSKAPMYLIVGCACAEIELDVLTGNQQILRVDIHEDTGMSMNPLLDVGQIEGAFMMGVGYWLTEKLEYDRRNGELLTNRTWNYKVPGAKDIPIDFRVKFLQNVNNGGMMRAKATGEPAICLSVVVLFALRHAIDSIRADIDGKSGSKWYRLGTGSTPDVVHTVAGVNVDDFKLG